jgi:thiosulfate/3-mercaptopyruvate sulfurtransferase
MRYVNPQYLVDTEWLNSHLEDADLRLLDCRVDMTLNAAGGLDFTPARQAWQQAHIPGAHFLDFVADLSAPDTDLGFMLPGPGQFSEVMSAHGVGEGTRVVVYDGFHNMWAARLWWMLREYGFSNAAVLNGGLTRWTREGRPLSDRVRAHPPARFVPRRDTHVILGKDDVLSALGAATTRIVDALPAEHYCGAMSFGYARSGHIRSAVNLPWSSVVDHETHAFLPAEDLQRVLDGTGVAPDQRIITYCGGGIAASAVALAFALMGRPEVSIYDGSLSEWSADPSLPMETA